MKVSRRIRAGAEDKSESENPPRIVKEMVEVGVEEPPQTSRKERTKREESP